MFRIEFVVGSITPSPVSCEEKSLLIALGQITIGEHSERFRASLEYWGMSDYESQWQSAIRRLVGGASKTALITEMHNPITARYVEWWPVYRVNNLIHVQNHILFLDKTNSPFEIERMDELVPLRCTVNEDGDPISEWTTAIDALLME